jgi:GNAT superfamily N-acetyltransferase
MEYKIAQTEDISEVLKLQELYLLANLKPHQRHDGFVTTPYTPEQIKEVISKKELFIAIDSTGVAAYIFAGSWDFCDFWPIFSYMFQTIDGLEYSSIKITRQNSFQYGPICVHERARGQGVAETLFKYMKGYMSKKYPIGITFINKLNHRSYAAHTRKMSLEVISEFEYNSNQYNTLAFLTAQF